MRAALDALAHEVAPAAGAAAPAAAASGALSASEFAHRFRRWYRIRTELLPPPVAAAWTPLAFDAETLAWLEAHPRSPWRDAAAAAMELVMSRTDANALTGRGHMFVASRAHVATLLRGLVRPRAALRVLDVGAGDGDVTAQVVDGLGLLCAEQQAGSDAAAAVQVVTTEASAAMARVLRGRGWECLGAARLDDEGALPTASFDLVCLLNLLDRCDDPAGVLRGARRVLRPVDGRVLIALVLPFDDCVEDGPSMRRPAKRLPMAGLRCCDGASVEASLVGFVERCLAPAGFVLERVARLPYLCQGDMRRDFYVLGDAVIVARPVAPDGEDPATAGGVEAGSIEAGSVEAGSIEAGAAPVAAGAGGGLVRGLAGEAGAAGAVAEPAAVIAAVSRQ
jgi:SAM-dependent methyltransferase